MSPTNRAADVAGERRHPGRECAGDAMLAGMGLDEQVLQKEAAGRHADDARGIFGDESDEAGFWAKAVAQPVGFGGAHRVQRILALRQ